MCPAHPLRSCTPVSSQQSAVWTSTPCYRDNKQTRKDSEVRFVSEHIKDPTEGFDTKLDWSVEPLSGNLEGTRVA
jgi:hypothetical protein